jgi:GTP-binding protein HflX
LRERIADILHRGAQLHEIELPASDGGRIAWLHARGDVIGQETRESQVHLSVRLSPENWARFQSL